MAEIVVDFQPNTAPLENAIDQLVASGRLTKDVANGYKEAAKQIDVINKHIATTGKVTKQTMVDLAAAVKKLPKEMQQGFEEGITQSLKDAGVTLKEFEDAVAAAAGTQQTLTQELKGLTQELARMQLAGDTSSERFVELSNRAGEMRDALNDTTATVNKFASDTKNLDSVISVISGVTAAFSVMQGAVALVGAEDEDTQKSIQKLQASMSVMMGIQEIANLLEKDSAALQGVTRIQRLAGVAATNLETAAKSNNIIVSKAATVAQWLLNAAMKANPVFLLISAFAAIGAALYYFAVMAETASEKQIKLNEAMKKGLDNLQEEDKVLRRVSDQRILKLNLELSALQHRKASQNEIMAKELQIAQAEQDRAKKSQDHYGNAAEGEAQINEKLTEQRAKLQDLTDEYGESQRGGVFGMQRTKAAIQENIDATKSEIENLQTKSDIAKTVNDEIATTNQNLADKRDAIRVKDYEDSLKSATATAQAQVSIVAEGTRAEVDARIIALRVSEKEELANVNLTQGERLKIIAETNKAIQDLEYNDQLRVLAGRKATAEAAMLNAEQNTKEEFDFQAAYRQAEMDLELKAAKNNEAEKARIRAVYRRKEEDANRESRAKQLENGLSNIQAESRELEISQQRREDVAVASLNKQREIELNGVVNNLNKIKEINSRYDQQIREEKVRLWEEALNRELELQQHFNDAIIADYGRELTAINRRSNAHGVSYRQRMALAQQAFALEQNLAVEETAQAAQEIGSRIALVQKEYDEGTISKEEYNRRIAALKAQEVEVHKKGEEKMLGITQDHAEKTWEVRKAEAMKWIGSIEEVGNAFNGILASMDERELAQIDARKKKLEEEKEAGSITQKAYEIRAKQIENAEIAAKTRAAKRDKAMALFSAIIAGARAVVEALPDPFLVAFAGAVALAQIAAIALKPIPKFGKGIEKAPRGFAEIGETGTEIVQTQKGYYVAEHPQIVWMKGGEKIYNPSETKQLMTKTPQTVEPEAIKATAPGFQMDYERLGDEIAKHPRNIISLDEQGFTTRIVKGSSSTTYKNKRHTFNG